MRKVLWFVFVAVLMASCEDIGADDVGHKLIEEFTVRNHEWVEMSDRDGLNPVLVHSRIFPALDRNVAANGVVMGYVEYNGLFYPMQSTTWVEGRNVNYAWEESVGFGYRENELVLFFRTSDFYYDDLVPMRFRFVLMW